MDRRRMLLAFGAAVPLALLASFLVYRELSRAAIKRANIPSVKVVLAATSLAPGTVLDAQNLRVAEWPASESVEGIATRLEDCAGRALLNGVVENEPILEADLAPKDAGAGLPAIIPRGLRAVSVAVNDVVGVAGFVQPGSNVDVIATGAPSSQGANITSRTVLENIRVLAAGQKIEPDKQGAPQTVSVVTLLVRPQDAGILVLASTEGRIQLALRNATDADQVKPPIVSEDAVFGSGITQAPVARMVSARAPAPAVSNSFGVEILRGNKEEMTEVPRP